MLLISAGSFGFLVWRDLLTYHIHHKLSLHTRFALTVGIIILILSIVGFLISEQNLKQIERTAFGYSNFTNLLTRIRLEEDLYKEKEPNSLLIEFLRN